MVESEKPEDQLVGALPSRCDWLFLGDFDAGALAGEAIADEDLAF